MQQVTKPGGVVSDWFLWLPVSLLEKLLDYIIMQICLPANSVSWWKGELVPLPTENGGNIGLSFILEAD